MSEEVVRDLQVPFDENAYQEEIKKQLESELKSIEDRAEIFEQGSSGIRER